jgi:hypothetical protein
MVNILIKKLKHAEIANSFLAVRSVLAGLSVPIVINHPSSSMVSASITVQLKDITIISTQDHAPIAQQLVSPVTPPKLMDVYHAHLVLLCRMASVKQDVVSLMVTSV